MNQRPATFEQINMIVGMEVNQATEYLKNLGYILRITRQDGTFLSVIQDFKPNRVNVFCEGNKISTFFSIG